MVFKHQKILNSTNHPFNYNLNLEFITNHQSDADVMICCHGYGGNHKILENIYLYKCTSNHLVSFNFPDYNIIERNYDVSKSVFGTIDELLPLLYVIRLCVVNAGLKRINLYGFSAGGGAIINALAVLNKSLYSIELEKIGITTQNRPEIIKAIENGLIILDSPLKSIDEIMRIEKNRPDLEFLANRYKKSNMCPINVLKELKGLRLTVFVHFQHPDEILSNEDDQLYIDRLSEANAGKTMINFGSDGGHNTFHHSLWKKYKEYLNLKTIS